METGKFYHNDLMQTEFKIYIESLIVKYDKTIWYNDGIKEVELIPQTPFEKAFMVFLLAYCSNRG